MNAQPFILSFAPTLRPSEESPTQFGGVPYSGGVIPNYGDYGDVAIDLSTAKVPARPVFALVNHDTNQRAGKAQLENDGSKLSLLGSFSLSTDSGKQVAAEFAEGAPWEFSIGIQAKIERFSMAKQIVLNGQSMTVNAVLRNAKVREVSFVPAGADPNTHAIAFARNNGSLEEVSLMDSNEVQGKLDAANQLIADLQVKLSAAEVEHGKAVASLEHSLKEECKRSLDFEARAIAAENEVKTIQLGVRVEAVKSLFAAIHREYSDEAAKPYVELEAGAFALLSADLMSFKPQNTSVDWLKDTTQSGKEADSAINLNAKLFNQVAGKSVKE
jgi:hypothetical protein